MSHDGASATLRRMAIAALMCVAATGCSPREFLARLVPPDVDRFARRVIDTLRTQPTPAVLTFLEPQLATAPSTLDSLEVVKRFVPTGTLDSLELIGAWVSNSTDGLRTRRVQYQMEAGGRWAVVQLVLNDHGSTQGVAGVRVWPLDRSLQSMNALTWREASPGALVAALCGIIALMFSLYAAVQVVRSPLRRRWIWVIVALLGFGKVSVDWHSGAVATQWLAVQLFGLGFGRNGLYGPWWILVSLPGGAAIALDRRRRALTAHSPLVEAGPKESNAEPSVAVAVEVPRTD